MYDGLLALLGVETDEEPEACVPTTMLLRRLSARVAAELPGLELNTREADLDDLSREERDQAVDEMVAGSEYPFVYLDGRLLWTGKLDLDAVFASLVETASC